MPTPNASGDTTLPFWVVINGAQFFSGCSDLAGAQALADAKNADPKKPPELTYSAIARPSSSPYLPPDQAKIDAQLADEVSSVFAAISSQGQTDLIAALTPLAPAVDVDADMKAKATEIFSQLSPAGRVAALARLTQEHK